MTFDLNSRLAVVTEPTASPNERTPSYDLDSVYGGGPLVDPELYVPAPRGSRARPTKLRIEHGGLFEDLPRNRDGSAIIADPRNDENLMIAGLQTAFIHVPQQVRRSRGPRPSPVVGGGVREGPPAHDLALPVDDRARVPAGLHRPGDGERHPAQRPAVLPAGGRLHPHRVPGRRLPLRSQHGAPVVPGESGRGQRRLGLLRDDLRPLGRGAGRSRRPARRRAGPSALHRLADVLRFRPDLHGSPATPTRRSGRTS